MTRIGSRTGRLRMKRPDINPLAVMLIVVSLSFGIATSLMYDAWHQTRNELAQERTDNRADRQAAEARSARAVAERAELLDQVSALTEQNRQLAAQIDALTDLLRRYGITIPSSGSSSEGSTDDASTSGSSSASSSRSSSGSQAAPTRPAPSSPTSPAAPSAPAPADDLAVCLPLLGCVL